MAPTTRKRQPSVEEKKKREVRLTANRHSAFKSRYRKMVYLDEIKRSESQMKVRNEKLSQENKVLQDMIHSLKQSQIQEEKMSVPQLYTGSTCGHIVDKTWNGMEYRQLPLELAFVQLQQDQRRKYLSLLCANNTSVQPFNNTQSVMKNGHLQFDPQCMKNSIPATTISSSDQWHTVRHTALPRHR